MAKDERKIQTKKPPGALNTFEPNGALGPIGQRTEYEHRLDALPPDQKDLAQESTRLADLCQYFSAQKMDIPPEIVEQIGNLRRLAIPERIGALKAVNRALMEYLNDVGKDPGIRQ